MKNVTVVFNKTMKMSDLVDADYYLLLLLLRLHIPLGFGEKDVETVCLQNGFDPDCFIFLANFQSNSSVLNIREEFNKLPVEPFLFYLKNSHVYFLEDRLPTIRRKLNLLLKDSENSERKVVLQFFDNYVKEVEDHMKYEDEVAFPYIRSLITKTDHQQGYSINIFEERHNNIEEKVNDLKRILMKYVSGIMDHRLMTNILIELYMTQDELEKHTYIEDVLIIPRIEEIERLF